VVGLVVLALVGASIVTGLPDNPATGAGQWLPADGHRVLYTQADTAGGWYAEWSRPDIYSLIQSDLLAFPVWLSKADAGASAQFLRWHSLQADPAGDTTRLTDRLWTVEPDGLRTAIAVDTTDQDGNLQVQVMVPGRLDLPAAVAAGDQWTSTGTVWSWNSESSQFDEATYEAGFTASPAAGEGLPGGCLDIVMDQAIAGQSDTERTTWCPGSGVVAFSGTTGWWAASTAVPPASVGSEDTFDWATADALEFTPLAVNQGGNTLTLNPVAPPGLLQGGALFAGKLQPDLLAVSTDGEPRVVWATRPGGTLTTAATLDGITMVATTQRTLVAYNGQGRWLWESRLPDVSVVPPVLFDGRVIVVTLDGTVLALDPATGDLAWTADVGAEIRATPVSSSGHLLVANQAGALTSLDGDGQTEWAKEVGVPESLAVSPGPDPVIVYGEHNSAALTAYSLADGHQVWRSRVYQTPRQLIALDAVVVLRDDTATLGVDWWTGQVVWRWSRQVTAAGLGGGDRVLLLADTDLVLLSADGREVRSWPHQLGHVTGTTPYLVATQGAVLAYGEQGAALGVTS